MPFTINAIVALTPEAQASDHHARTRPYVAAALGVRPVIVIPSHAPPTKIAKTQASRGEMMLVANSSHERAARPKWVADR